MNKLRIVLDTNVILSSLSFHSKYRHIIDELMNGTYGIFLTTDVKLGFPKVNLINIKNFSDFLQNKV